MIFFFLLFGTLAVTYTELPLTKDELSYVNQFPEVKSKIPSSADRDEGLYISNVFSDNAVLQREPAVSAIYGDIVGLTEPCLLVVGIADQDSGNYYQARSELRAPAPDDGTVWWKAWFEPTPAGGRFTITATCQGKDSRFFAMIKNVTFGMVWFCSGQSNMWLPITHTFNRNRTMANLDKHQHIRTLLIPQVTRKDGQELFVANKETYPNVAYAPQKSGPVQWRLPDEGVVDMFSAACWYFAEETTKLWREHGEEVIPMGLIGSYWGGTIIQQWSENSTLTCKNATGGSAVYQRSNRPDGSIFNAMVLPFVNMTIEAALWYQGENNILECKVHGGRSTDIWNTCGTTEKGEGYGCFQENMIRTWRKWWSVESGTTDPNFSFGVVSLAGGTSEGHSGLMPHFRWSQTSDCGLLPNTRLPNTFIAQAYDIPDPMSAPDYNTVYGPSAPWTSTPGMKAGIPYTQDYMGGLHPRFKRLVGERLARAARVHHFGKADTAWSGPSFKGCYLNRTGHGPYGSTIWIDIYLDLSATNGEEVDFMGRLSESTQFKNYRTMEEVSMYSDFFLYPMEVEIRNQTWISTFPFQVEGTTFIVGSQLRQGDWEDSDITGLRWAWRDVPCCPNFNRNIQFCYPNACGFYIKESGLPMPPFWVKIVDGKCQQMSDCML